MFTFQSDTSNISICNRCKIGVGDIRIGGCGCVLHTRCTRLPEAGESLVTCPHCRCASTGTITLLPLSFHEIDEARKEAATSRGPPPPTQADCSIPAYEASNGAQRKRTVSSLEDQQQQGSSSGSLQGGAALPAVVSEDTEQRTGRWTPAETSFVDELIVKFGEGSIPVPEGDKLHDFLATILLCKGSRLTKKMKNAKLSSRCFKKMTGFIADLGETLEFSALEEAFFLSITCPVERSVIKFHMQRHWREMFCHVCSEIGLPIDAEAWLNSIEEVERRSSIAKVAARLKKRKQMIRHAINQDSHSPESGVIIDQHGLISSTVDEFSIDSSTDDPLLFYSFGNHEVSPNLMDEYSNNSSYSSPTFLQKVMEYFASNNVPFEHVDLWVPSYTPISSSFSSLSPDGCPFTMMDANSQKNNTNNGCCSAKCRLVFAGCATKEASAASRYTNVVEPLTHDEYFAMSSFGTYSERFSFEIGSGLPGRLYQTGIPTWDQNIQNAPRKYFERIVGAIQFGIRTVVGIPIPSPDVGRIIMLLYSTHDVVKDEILVERLLDAFSQLAPSLKLIVDVGMSSCGTIKQQEPDFGPATKSYNQIMFTNNPQDSRVGTLLAILAENMPPDCSSNLSHFLPGFISLRLLLLKSTHSDHEKELLLILLDSYNSFVLANRSPRDIAALLAMDCMFLMQQHQQQHQHQTGNNNNNSVSSSFGSSSSLMMLEQQKLSHQPLSSTSRTHFQHPQQVHNFSVPSSEQPQSAALPCISYMHHPSQPSL